MNIMNQDLSFLQDRGQVMDYQSARQTRFNAMRKETQDITITTEEGDKVTISALSKFQASYMAFDYTEQIKGENTKLQAEELSASTKHAFSMTVEGDLNAEEQADIEKVLGRLDGLMQDLVSGDLEGLMEEATTVIDDTETISGLNAKLQYQQRVTMQRRTMQRVTYGPGGHLPPPPHENMAPPPPGERNMVSASDIIAQITGKVLDLLDSSKVDNEKLKEPVEGYFKQLLESLNNEKGMDHPMTQLVDQMQAEMLGRLEE